MSGVIKVKLKLILSYLSISVLFDHQFETCLLPLLVHLLVPDMSCQLFLSGLEIGEVVEAYDHRGDERDE